MTGELERILQEAGREKDIESLRQALRDVFAWHSRDKGIGYSDTRNFPGNFFKRPAELLERELKDFLVDETPGLRISTIEDLGSDPDRYLVLSDLGLVDLTVVGSNTNVDINLRGAQIVTNGECRTLITIEDHFRTR